jgi:hypothetical protein
MPALRFDDCRLMGFPIVNTKPRQCLLPEDGIMLETEEQPTAKSLKATNFDSCLNYGQSLINTFPRRCVAAGGRVFSEPPRVYEPAAHEISASIVLSTTTPSRTVIKNDDLQSELKADISATAVSPTQLETVQGLGTYAVSPAVPTSMTAIVSGMTPRPLFTGPLNVSPTISATIAVSATLNISTTMSVPVSPVAVMPVVVSPTPVMVISPMVVVSPMMVMPVNISATVGVSMSVPVSASILPVSPTASVSSFDVQLGK